jgi:hypothetical protein
MSKNVCRVVCVSVLLAIVGCWTETSYALTSRLMLANTVLLSQLGASDNKGLAFSGLTVDLSAVHIAWQEGSPERTPLWIHRVTVRTLAMACLISLVGLLVWRRRRNSSATKIRIR